MSLLRIIINFSSEYLSEIYSKEMTIVDEFLSLPDKQVNL